MWILPTLSRPRQCAEVLYRIKSIGCSTPGVVFVNANSFPEEIYSELPDGWMIHIHKSNVGALGAMNFIFNRHPNEPFYGFIGDDEFLMLESPSDWDKRLISAAGNWGASHGWEDMNDGRRLQGYVCLGGDLVRAVGYLAVKECWHNFGFDSAWEWLGGTPIFGAKSAYKISFVPEVRVSHKHSCLDRSRQDECYDLGYSTFEEDRKRFVDWQRGDMQAAAERIKKAKQMVSDTMKDTMKDTVMKNELISQTN